MALEKYLPIGTVVLLKDASKELMIISYGIFNDQENRMYDYLACLYPEGVIAPDKNFLFNHEQIDKVLYLGYSEEQWKEFKPKLEEALSKAEKEIKK